MPQGGGGPGPKKKAGKEEAGGDEEGEEEDDDLLVMRKGQQQAGTDQKGTIWTAGVNSGRGSHYKRSPLRVRKPMFSSSSNRAPSSSYPASKTNPSGSVNQRRLSEAGGLEREGEESQVHLVYSHTSAMNG